MNLKINDYQTLIENNKMSILICIYQFYDEVSELKSKVLLT